MPRRRALSIRSPHHPRARKPKENNDNGLEISLMKLTCGVDWAEAHHDVALVDEDGVVVARARIDTGATGFNKLLALIAEHEGSAEDTPSFDRNRQEPARRRVGRSRVHGISDQPAGGGPLSGTLRPGRRQVRSRRCGSARAHSAHRPTSAPPDASGQRAGTRSQGAGPSAPRGDLGVAPNRQPSTIGVVGVLSASAASISESHTQGSIDCAGSRADPGKQPAADPSSSSDIAAAIRPR